jgi:alanine racemase
MAVGPRATIDLSALRHNLGIALGAAPGSQPMPVIKANAYGHGVLRVAQTLADLAPGFAVARVAEAVALREAGIQHPITVLQGFNDPDELQQTIRHRLRPTLHHPEQLAILEQQNPADALHPWIKIDSGMHRAGLLPEEVAAALQRLNRLPCTIQPPGFLTHLACADDRNDPMTERQLTTFRQLLPPGAEISIANSAGILGWPASHGGWSRPGIMLYGASPFVGRTGPQEDLRPVMTLETQLIATKRIAKGESIGYGATWRCPESMDIGIAAIGYGDGYPRHAPSGTPTLVNGRPAPLVGRVSMDMLTLDLRQHPEAKIGDRVVLWGEGLPADMIADHAGTIAYELFCGLTQRVGFVYGVSENSR